MFYNIALYTLLPPIGIGVYRLKALGREMKIFIVYLTIAFVTALLGNIRIQWATEIMHINIIIEYLFVMLLISFWQESPSIKKFMRIIYWLYIPFWFIAKFTFEPIAGSYSITLSVSQVIMALSAGYTLFVVIVNYTQPLHRSQLFWVLIALVLNYTSTLIPMALGSTNIIQPGKAMVIVYSVAYVLIIISNILFTIGFLCPPTQSSSSR